MKRLALPLLLLLALACNRDETSKALATPQPPKPIGNAGRGKELVAQYGCNVCHTVPGIDGPQGSLGPSLDGVASRPAVSFGAVQNTPENLVKFIREPASMNPQSSMPPIALTEADAKDVVAYLMTLK